MTIVFKGRTLDKTVIPPQIVILAIIAKSNEGITLKDVAVYMDKLCKAHKVPLSYYPCGGANGTLRELLLDINTLKVLGLVKEANGRYVITEKGCNVLKRFSESNNTIRSILSLRL